jgi:exodeoxyribonuclease VII large subunit
MAQILTNAKEYTVSELAFSVRRTVEDEFGNVRVRGEISGFKGQHSSGHAYFTLKDADAAIEAVVWRTAWVRLQFKPQEGLEVIASGRLTTFPKSSKYQIVVEQLQPAGAGALMVVLEQLRKRLAAEGLFAKERKRALPYLPSVIGVVTSPTGAVIRDILHRLADRFPRPVLVWPVRVQGETSAAEIVGAIEGFNRLGATGARAQLPRPDIIILARGGGSIEDLWSFNEETVVRAVVASRIPIISAVGHETDTTLVDHAADLRAPTPTAAAEYAVPVRSELIGYVDDQGQRIRHSLRRSLGNSRDRLRAAAGTLPRPLDILGAAGQRLDRAASLLRSSLELAFEKKKSSFAALVPHVSARALERALAVERHQFDHLSRRIAPAARRFFGVQADRLGALGKLLNSLSYERVLDRGFAVVLDDAGEIVRAPGEVQPGESLTARLAEGDLGVTASGAPALRRRGRPKPASPDDGQTSLF